MGYDRKRMTIIVLSFLLVLTMLGSIPFLASADDNDWTDFKKMPDVRDGEDIPSGNPDEISALQNSEEGSEYKELKDIRDDSSSHVEGSSEDAADVSEGMSEGMSGKYIGSLKELDESETNPDDYFIDLGMMQSTASVLTEQEYEELKDEITKYRDINKDMFISDGMAEGMSFSDKNKQINDKPQTEGSSAEKTTGGKEETDNKDFMPMKDVTEGASGKTEGASTITEGSSENIEKTLSLGAIPEGMSYLSYDAAGILMHELMVYDTNGGSDLTKNVVVLYTSELELGVEGFYNIIYAVLEGENITALFERYYYIDPAPVDEAPTVTPFLTGAIGGIGLNTPSVVKDLATEAGGNASEFEQEFYVDFELKAVKGAASGTDLSDEDEVLKEVINWTQQPYMFILRKTHILTDNNTNINAKIDDKNTDGVILSYQTDINSENNVLFNFFGKNNKEDIGEKFSRVYEEGVFTGGKDSGLYPQLVNNLVITSQTAHLIDKNGNKANSLADAIGYKVIRKYKDAVYHERETDGAGKILATLKPKDADKMKFEITQTYTVYKYMKSAQIDFQVKNLQAGINYKEIKLKHMFIPNYWNFTHSNMTERGQGAGTMSSVPGMPLVYMTSNKWTATGSGVVTVRKGNAIVGLMADAATPHKVLRTGAFSPQFVVPYGKFTRSGGARPTRWGLLNQMGFLATAALSTGDLDGDIYPFFDYKASGTDAEKLIYQSQFFGQQDTTYTKIASDWDNINKALKKDTGIPSIFVNLEQYYRALGLSEYGDTPSIWTGTPDYEELEDFKYTNEKTDSITPLYIEFENLRSYKDYVVNGIMTPLQLPFNNINTSTVGLPGQNYTGAETNAGFIRHTIAGQWTINGLAGSATTEPQKEILLMSDAGNTVVLSNIPQNVIPGQKIDFEFTVINNYDETETSFAGKENTLDTNKMQLFLELYDSYKLYQSGAISSIVKYQDDNMEKIGSATDEKYWRNAIMLDSADTIGYKEIKSSSTDKQLYNYLNLTQRDAKKVVASIVVPTEAKDGDIKNITMLSSVKDANKGTAYDHRTSAGKDDKSDYLSNGTVDDGQNADFETKPNGEDSTFTIVSYDDTDARIVDVEIIGFNKVTKKADLLVTVKTRNTSQDFDIDFTYSDYQKHDATVSGKNYISTSAINSGINPFTVVTKSGGSSATVTKTASGLTGNVTDLQEIEFKDIDISHLFDANDANNKEIPIFLMKISPSGTSDIEFPHEYNPMDLDGAGFGPPEKDEAIIPIEKDGSGNWLINYYINHGINDFETEFTGDDGIDLTLAKIDETLRKTTPKNAIKLNIPDPTTIDKTDSNVFKITNFRYALSSDKNNKTLLDETTLKDTLLTTPGYYSIFVNIGHDYTTNTGRVLFLSFDLEIELRVNGDIEFLKTDNFHKWVGDTVTQGDLNNSSNPYKPTASYKKYDGSKANLTLNNFSSDLDTSVAEKLDFKFAVTGYPCTKTGTTHTDAKHSTNKSGYIHDKASVEIKDSHFFSTEASTKTYSFVSTTNIFEYKQKDVTYFNNVLSKATNATDLADLEIIFHTGTNIYGQPEYNTTQKAYVEALFDKTTHTIDYSSVNMTDVIAQFPYGDNTHGIITFSLKFKAGYTNPHLGLSEADDTIKIEISDRSPFDAQITPQELITDNVNVADEDFVDYYQKNGVVRYNVSGGSYGNFVTYTEADVTLQKLTESIKIMLPPLKGQTGGHVTANPGDYILKMEYLDGAQYKTLDAAALSTIKSKNPGVVKLKYEVNDIRLKAPSTNHTTIYYANFRINSEPIKNASGSLTTTFTPYDTFVSYDVDKIPENGVMVGHYIDYLETVKALGLNKPTDTELASAVSSVTSTSRHKDVNYKTKLSDTTNPLTVGDGTHYPFIVNLSRNLRIHENPIIDVSKIKTHYRVNNPNYTANAKTTAKLYKTISTAVIDSSTNTGSGLKVPVATPSGIAVAGSSIGINFSSTAPRYTLPIPDFSDNQSVFADGLNIDPQTKDVYIHGNPVLTSSIIELEISKNIANEIDFRNLYLKVAGSLTIKGDLSGKTVVYNKGTSLSEDVLYPMDDSTYSFTIPSGVRWMTSGEEFNLAVNFSEKNNNAPMLGAGANYTDSTLTTETSNTVTIRVKIVDIAGTAPVLTVKNAEILVTLSYDLTSLVTEATDKNKNTTPNNAQSDVKYFIYDPTNIAGHYKGAAINNPATYTGLNSVDSYKFVAELTDTKLNEVRKTIIVDVYSPLVVDENPKYVDIRKGYTEQDVYQFQTNTLFKYNAPEKPGTGESGTPQTVKLTVSSSNVTPVPSTPPLDINTVGVYTGQKYHGIHPKFSVSTADSTTYNINVHNNIEFVGMSTIENANWNRYRTGTQINTSSLGAEAKDYNNANPTPPTINVVVAPANPIYLSPGIEIIQIIAEDDLPRVGVISIKSPKTKVIRDIKVGINTMPVLEIQNKTVMVKKGTSQVELINAIDAKAYVYYYDSPLTKSMLEVKIDTTMVDLNKVGYYANVPVTSADRYGEPVSDLIDVVVFSDPEFVFDLSMMTKGNGLAFYKDEYEVKDVEDRVIVTASYEVPDINGNIVKQPLQVFFEWNTSVVKGGGTEEIRVYVIDPRTGEKFYAKERIEIYSLNRPYISGLDMQIFQLNDAVSVDGSEYSTRAFYEIPIFGELRIERARAPLTFDRRDLDTSVAGTYHPLFVSKGKLLDFRKDDISFHKEVKAIVVPISAETLADRERKEGEYFWIQASKVLHLAKTNENWYVDVNNYRTDGEKRKDLRDTSQYTIREDVKPPVRFYDMSAEILEVLQEQKNSYLEVDAGKTIWKFHSKDFQKSSPRISGWYPLNMKTSSTNEDIEKLISGEGHVYMEFAMNRDLTGKANIQINLGSKMQESFDKGNKIYLFDYNEDTNELELVGRMKAEGEGKFSIDVTEVRLWMVALDHLPGDTPIGASDKEKTTSSSQSDKKDSKVLGYRISHITNPLDDDTKEAISKNLEAQGKTISQITLGEALEDNDSNFLSVFENPFIIVGVTGLIVLIIVTILLFIKKRKETATTINLGEKDNTEE